MSQWYWRSLPLTHRTGSDIFERLYAKESIATLLESPDPTPTPDLCRYSICAGAPRQLWTPKIGEILPFLNHLLDSNAISSLTDSSPNSFDVLSSSTIDSSFPLSSPNSQIPMINHFPAHLPFIGGWLGWLGYDLAWEIEKLPKQNRDSLPFPVAYWYEPETFAVLDHQEQILWLAATQADDLERLATLLEQAPSPLCKNTIASSPITFCTAQADYEASVRQALKYIKAGDIFQTNLSLRFTTTTHADSWQIYRTLQQINPSPFASYWRTPWGVVVSCSPERLVQLDNHKAQTRPIAGTRPRGVTPEADQKLAEELKTNVKEQAEHIMLVDLERNDLGRVCRWGSVQVDELLTIERYSHVMHLVSNISGVLHPKYNSIDLIRSLFPGGTITGCPKVRCMEIIEELEPFSRSLFYGSCGYLDQRGHLDLNILIRTLLFTPEQDFYQVWGQVGAGIVADSDPEREWYESLNKAEAQLAALRLSL